MSQNSAPFTRERKKLTETIVFSTGLKTQVVCCCEKKNVATAVDIVGVSRQRRSVVLIELKYSSHAVQNLNRVYKIADPSCPRLRYINARNCLHNHHQLQLRETIRLFRLTHGKTCPRVEGGVLVICADGGIVFNASRARLLA